MADRPIRRSARPGRHSRCTDLGRKTRCFPIGSARLRLREVLHPPTFDDHVVAWLGRAHARTRVHEAIAADWLVPTPAVASRVKVAVGSIAADRPEPTPTAPGPPLPNSARDDATPPPELAEVMGAWTSLPEAIRVGILAIVRASSALECGGATSSR